MIDAFDLDAFAPAPINIVLHGRTYGFPADPDVDQVARMLRIEKAIKDANGADETVAAVTEGRDLLLVMARETDASIETFPVGASQVLVIFALLVHGSSVAAAVAHAIAPSRDEADDSDGENDDDDGHELGGETDSEAVDAAPLGSAKRSSGRSSGSDEPTVGRPVTGRA